MTVLLCIFLLLIGSIGGLLVGLAGVGSTLLVLPTLLIGFSLLFHSAISLKLAVGTTLACGMTAASISAYHYIKLGHAQSAVFLRVAPVYLFTSVVGPLLVHWMSVSFFHVFVGVVLAVISGFVVFSTQLGGDSNQKDINTAGMLVAACIAGLLTSMSGVATGVILVPYLCRYMPRLQAVGSSVCCAVVGCGVATMSYIVSGFHQSSVALPMYSFGYVYLPAYAMLAIGVAVFTPVGVKLAKRMSILWFRFLLALLLCASGIYSIWLVL